MDFMDKYNTIDDVYKSEKVKKAYEKAMVDPKSVDKFVVLIEKILAKQTSFNDMLTKYTTLKTVVPIKGTPGSGALNKRIVSIDGKISTITEKTISPLLKQMTAFVDAVNSQWSEKIVYKDAQLADYIAKVSQFLDTKNSPETAGIVARCHYLLAEIGDQNSFNVSELQHHVNNLKPAPAKKRKQKVLSCSACNKKTTVQVASHCLDCVSDNFDARIHILSGKERRWSSTQPSSSEVSKYETESTTLYERQNNSYTHSEAKLMHSQLSKCEKMLKNVEYTDEDLSSSSSEEDMDIEEDDEFEEEFQEEFQEDCKEDIMTDTDRLRSICTTSEIKRKRAIECFNANDLDGFDEIFIDKTFHVHMIHPTKKHRVSPIDQPVFTTEDEAQLWITEYKKDTGMDDWTNVIE